MVTVKRNELNENVSGNTALLEREDVVSKKITSSRLESLLEYDSFAIADAETATPEFVVPKEEDITPSSTTMQFQNVAPNESARDFYDSHVNEEKFSFSLNAKGKILIGVYAAIVTLIVAAIIVIASVNRSLSQALVNKSQEVYDLKSEYSQIVDEIEEITSDSYISNEAENIGMVNGN